VKKLLNLDHKRQSYEQLSVCMLNAFFESACMQAKDFKKVYVCVVCVKRKDMLGGATGFCTKYNCGFV
jgi:hypothetical protein